MGKKSVDLLLWQFKVEIPDFKKQLAVLKGLIFFRYMIPCTQAVVLSESLKNLKW